MAADRPSLLAATTHANFFPHWMAGPLGGLLAGSDAQHDTTLQLPVHGRDRARCTSSYLLALLRYVAAPARARWAIAAVVGGARDLPAGAAAGADGHLQLHQLRAHGGRAPPQPVHDDPDPRAPQRPELRRSATGTSCSAPTARCSRCSRSRSCRSAWRRRSGRSRRCSWPRASGTILLVWKCARLLGRDPVQAIVLVGLNPIVLVWGLGGDHNDFLMMFCHRARLLPAAARARRGSARGLATQARRCGAAQRRARGVRGRGWLPLCAAGDRRRRGVRHGDRDQGLGRRADPGRAREPRARAASACVQVAARHAARRAARGGASACSRSACTSPT